MKGWCKGRGFGYITKEKRIKILQDKEGEKMALSGAFEGSIKNGHYKVRVEWSATQNVANNTSTITAKMYMINDQNMEISARSNAHSLTIDGTTSTFSTSAISGTGSRLIGTATKTVTHNSDGTKSVAMSAVFALKAYFGSEYVANITASSTITLNTIARASQPTLSAASTVMGSAVTINTNRASSNFTHTLTYSFGSASGTIASSVGVSTSWTIPLDLAKQIPNATSGTGTITCKTYNGSTLIGTKTVSFTATVPSSVVPSISAISCSDPNGFATTYGGYVQSKSAVKVAVTAAGSNSSTIKSYKITANGANYSENNCTTGVLTTSGSNTISVTVTDSRGRTATKTAAITVLAYTSPKISTLTAVRCLSNGTEDEDGAYMKVTVGASITSLNSKNTKSFVLKYKQNTATTWTTGKSWTTAYSVSESVIIAANVDYSYNIQLVVTDAFGSAIADSVVGTSFTLIDFRNTGKGIAFGKASEQDAFECNMPAIFKSCSTQAGADLDNLNTRTSTAEANINTINGNLTPKLSVTSSSVSVTVATGATSTVVASIDLDEGLWYVTCDTRWEAKNTTGLRSMYFTTSGTGTTIRNLNTINGAALLRNDNGFNESATTQVLSGIVRVTTARTWNLHISQTSGASLNTAYNRITAYKISRMVV